MVSDAVQAWVNLPFNRTSMESKLKMPRRRGQHLSLLIEPVWNRNK